MLSSPANKYNMALTDTKPALHPLLAARRSLRAFLQQQVESEKLEIIFEAARWTASSMNEQPWRYIYATKADPPALAALQDCLVPSNQVWANQAPVLILSIAKTLLSHNQKANKHAWHDVGAANMAMALQAVSLGLVLHPMGGFDAIKARSTFNLPDGYEPVIMMALGYPGDPARLPELLRQREVAPRQRRPVSAFAFPKTWQDQPAETT